MSRLGGKAQTPLRPRRSRSPPLRVHASSASTSSRSPGKGRPGHRAPIRLEKGKRQTACKKTAFSLVWIACELLLLLRK